MMRLDQPIPRRNWLARLAAAVSVPAIAGALTDDAVASDVEATQAVFDHHLGAFAQGIDALVSDYTDESVVVTPDAAHKGLKEIRAFFQAFLDGATPEFWKAFKISSRSVHGEIAYLVWSSHPSVPMATDTLLVRNGKILVQTFTPFKA